MTRGKVNIYFTGDQARNQGGNPP